MLSKPVRPRSERVSIRRVMAIEGRRHLSRALRVLLLALPIGLALTWLWRRPEPVASRFDDALDRALAPVMEQREVQLKLRVATASQARSLARELALRSVPYVAPRDLELWQATRLRVARSSPEACARLWLGGDVAFLGPAIAALGDEPLDAYTAMLARGLALRLERKPPPAFLPDALARGFAAIAAALPPEEGAAFRNDVQRRDVTPARACELFLTLSREAEHFDPAPRTDFYRALARNLGPDL